MATTSQTIDNLLTEHDVARITGMSVAWVRRRRLLGVPPRFIKISRAVRYRPQDLAAFLDACPTGGGENRRTS